MHYKKRKKGVKTHSGSFYLNDEFLSVLALIAEFEKQSKSVIVERILRFNFNELLGEREWENAKKSYKKTKKIYFKKVRFKRARQKSENEAFKQKSLFENLS